MILSISVFQGGVAEHRPNSCAGRYRVSYRMGAELLALVPALVAYRGAVPLIIPAAFDILQMFLRLVTISI